jgi:hydroxymethylpyrimidine pyrophosphatase-like HAD family hydrolase
MNLLFFSDVDGTLVPELHVKDRQRQDEIQILLDMVINDHQIPFFLSTGRRLDQVKSDPLLADILYRFNGICCNVGTEIFLRRADGEWDDCTDAYTDWILSQTPPEKQQFNPDIIKRRIAKICADEGFDLHLQPDSHNGRIKLSYDLRTIDTEIQLKRILEEEFADTDLRVAPCAGQSVCPDYDGPVVHFDLFPALAGKRGATLYLQDFYSADGIIYCGDSGNDAWAIDPSNSSHYMIIPSNGQEALRDWASEHLDEGNVYVANQRIAAGVLEGCQYYFTSLLVQQKEMS